MIIILTMLLALNNAFFPRVLQVLYVTTNYDRYYH